MRQKIDQINENANQRYVEELCKNMKDGNTTFKTVREKQLCDPNNLKEHFHAHFKICSKSVNPFELKDVKMPSFIRQVQGIYTSEAN